MANGNAFGKNVKASFGPGNGGMVAASNNGKGKEKGLENNPTYQEDELEFISSGEDTAADDSATLNQIVDIPFFIPEPEETPETPESQPEPMPEIEPTLPIEIEIIDYSMFMD